MQARTQGGFVGCERTPPERWMIFFFFNLLCRNPFGQGNDLIIIIIINGN